MQRVVLKQSYKPKNDKKTPMLNVKHFRYICTRPGAIHNPGCGFSLFGKLPGQFKPSHNINNYEKTKELIREVSKTKTIYRNIISVSDETAKELGYYDREKFQKLIEENAYIFKNEHFGKDLSIKDFGWVASFHYKRGHPHIHIMYWNNSEDPQSEGMSSEKFEVFADKVKNRLVRGMYSEEFREIGVDTKLDLQTAKSEIDRLFSEYQKDVLNLDCLNDKLKKELAEDFIKIARHMPATYDFTYDSLPKSVKDEINAWTDRLFSEVYDFADIYENIVDTSEKINKLKQNSPEEAEKELERLKKRLYRAVGEPLVKSMGEFVKTLKATGVPEDEEALSLFISSEAVRLISRSDEVKNLALSMPEYRVPYSVLFEDEKFKAEFDNAVSAVATNVLLQSKVEAFIETRRSDEVIKRIAEIKEMLGISKSGDKEIDGEEETQEDSNVVMTKALTVPLTDEQKKILEDELKELRQSLNIITDEDGISKGDGAAKELRRAAFSAVSKLILQNLQEGKGWEPELAVDLIVSCLIRAFRDLSEERESRQSKYDILKSHYRELSEEALKDLRQKQSSSSSWEVEM